MKPHQKRILKYLERIYSELHIHYINHKGDVPGQRLAAGYYEGLSNGIKKALEIGSGEVDSVEELMDAILTLEEEGIPVAHITEDN